MTSDFALAGIATLLLFGVSVLYIFMAVGSAKEKHELDITIRNLGKIYIPLKPGDKVCHILYPRQHMIVDRFEYIATNNATGEGLKRETKVTCSYRDKGHWYTREFPETSLRKV